MSSATITRFGCAVLIAFGVARASVAADTHRINPRAPRHVASGEVVKVNALDHGFVLRTHTASGRSRELRFVVADDVTVTRGDVTTGPGDLRPKEQVEVTYRMDRRKYRAERIAIGPTQTPSAPAPDHEAPRTTPSK